MEMSWGAIPKLDQGEEPSKPRGAADSRRRGMVASSLVGRLVISVMSVGSASHENRKLGIILPPLLLRLPGLTGPLCDTGLDFRRLPFSPWRCSESRACPLARSLLSRLRLGVGPTIPIQAPSAVALKRKNGCSQSRCGARAIRLQSRSGRANRPPLPPVICPPRASRRMLLRGRGAPYGVVNRQLAQALE
jgi:hypothetical protein